MTENELSYKVRGAIFNVYNCLGPGLFESAYEAALCCELREMGLNISRQVSLPMFYKSTHIDVGYRIDVVVEQKLLVEIKSVEVLAEVHHKQIITYLKLSGLKLGLLVNFNTHDIRQGIFRKVNGL